MAYGPSMASSCGKKLSSLTISAADVVVIADLLILNAQLFPGTESLHE